uniref:Uncharacterized protein n=1 Tax=Oryza nivara TaxID=4536 RepID=A0A0E0IIF6_ORYNI
MEAFIGTAAQRLKCMLMVLLKLRKLWRSLTTCAVKTMFSVEEGRVTKLFLILT